MKFKFAALPFVFSAFLFSLFLSAPDSVGAQVTPQVQIQKRAVARDEIFKSVAVGDGATSVTASGLPTADLAIKDVCIGKISDNWHSLNVLIANVGGKDAESFVLGVDYIYPPNELDIKDRWDISNPIAPLKAGEQRWLAFQPLCCGWAGTASLVDNAVKYQIIADPKYYESDPSDPLQKREVKSKIPEANKKNNAAFFLKSEVKSCDAMRRADAPQTPNLKIVKPLALPKKP